ncbi:MAG: hypothetical protein ABH803_01310 [Candidatus Micrarchaeota archaeon]
MTLILAAFFDALLLVIWIIDFIALNNVLKGVVSSSLISLVIAGMVTYLLVIPYTWFAIVLFFALFGYAFFWGFQPWDWGTEEKEFYDADKDAKKMKYAVTYDPEDEGEKLTVKVK